MHEKYSFTLDEAGSRLASSYVQSLIRYSAGVIPRPQVMQDLGINYYGVLLQRLNSHCLPTPILPGHIRQRMADDLVQVLTQRCV